MQVWCVNKDCIHCKGEMNSQGMRLCNLEKIVMDRHDDKIANNNCCMNYDNGKGVNPMWIYKPLCQHPEFKNFCKWYRDGNCALNISEENKPPCATTLERMC